MKAINGLSYWHSQSKKLPRTRIILVNLWPSAADTRTIKRLPECCGVYARHTQKGAVTGRASPAVLHVGTEVVLAWVPHVVGLHRKFQRHGSRTAVKCEKSEAAAETPSPPRPARHGDSQTLDLPQLSQCRPPKPFICPHLYYLLLFQAPIIPLYTTKTLCS